MKRTIYTTVSALALLAAAPALAQSNESTVTQSGDTQTASVTQSGANDVSFVTQENANNTATVSQAGDTGSYSRPARAISHR